VQKLTRKDKKVLKDEVDRLNKLSQREMQAYMMIKDPNNKFMRKLTLEGTQGLAELQRDHLWQSIMAKKQLHHDNLNDLLNSLTDDEFNEFIQARDVDMNKLQETGKESEGFTLRPEKEERLEIKEQVLAELA
jgi:hypothetical protein